MVTERVEMWSASLQLQQSPKAMGSEIKSYATPVTNSTSLVSDPQQEVTLRVTYPGTNQ